MRDAARSPIAHLVEQQAEELAVLATIRLGQVDAPHVRLRHLRRLDDRIAAYVDALAVAGADGTRACAALLADVGPGEACAVALLALVNGDDSCLDRMIALAEATPAAETGLLAAFNLVSARFLTGIVRDCLASGHGFRRRVGIAACAMHGVDPGAALVDALAAADAGVRAAALRAAGEGGRVDLLAACLQALQDEPVRADAARAAALLGAATACVGPLTAAAMQPGPKQAHALRLVLSLVDPADARHLLTAAARTSAGTRLSIRGAGAAGDPYYVPWLLRQMQEATVARLAGEAFTLIAGADLDWLDLDGPALTDEDHEDEDGADDDGLPWPDPVKVAAWWQANHGRFTPGVRYFLGQPPTVAHCRAVLRDGSQRQRSAAADYLCLLQPGTRLFQTGAPAWRQERWLGQSG